MKERRFSLSVILILALCLGLVLSACGAKGAAPQAGGSPQTSDSSGENSTAGQPADQGAGGSPQTSDSSGENNNTGAFPVKFTTVDLYGNTVTEKSLGEKKLFFVHYWATWCGPCVNEMPDLSGLVSEYEDRVGFIALLDDFSTNPDGAKKIIESAGIPASFIMVDAQAPEMEKLLAMVQTGYVPTTVLLGLDGKMLGSPLIGSQGTVYADTLDKLLA